MPATGGNNIPSVLPASSATPPGPGNIGTITSSNRAPRTVRYVHSRPDSPRASANRASASSSENAQIQRTPFRSADHRSPASSRGTNTAVRRNSPSNTANSRRAARNCSCWISTDVAASARRGGGPGRSRSASRDRLRCCSGIPSPPVVIRRIITCADFQVQRDTAYWLESCRSGRRETSRTAQTVLPGPSTHGYQPQRSASAATNRRPRPPS